jgi:hypothetical protein
MSSNMNMSHLRDAAKLAYVQILKDYETTKKLMNDIMPENPKAPRSVYPESIRLIKVAMVYEQMEYLRNHINTFAFIMSKNCGTKGGRKTRKNNRK